MGPAPSRTPSEQGAGAPRSAALAGGLAGGLVVALGVLGAAAALTWSALATTSARFAGTTQARSLFEAADIELRLGDAATADGGSGPSAAVQIAADELYPGLVIERCLPVTYRGSLDEVTVRLHAERAGGTGLERHVEAVLVAGTGAGADCADFRAARELYRGTLDALWAQHGSFERGLALLDEGVDGESVTVRVELGVVGDNAAQGLESAFWLVIEARP